MKTRRVMMNYARAVGWARVVILSAALVGLTGCFSSNPADIAAFKRPQDVDVTAETYILQPPDEVEVHCTSVPEIDNQRQRIRPDGKITFESLGEIQAAGRSVAEVAGEIQKRASNLYKLNGQNLVDLQIVTYRSKVYHVLGEVFFPGPKNFTGRDTVLSALSDARPTVLAWKERVQIIRPSRLPGLKPKIFEVNYDRMMAHGDVRKDVLLQEGDIVYVPPTVLAWIAERVEEFVRPIGRAFSTAFIVQRTEAGP